MAKPASAPQTTLFDAELVDLPETMRWREWMGRVEAAVFASAEPVPREALARLVGRECVLDDLIADICDELKGRPYELAFVAGGFQHRTRARFADAIRAAANVPDHNQAPDLTKLEALVLAAVAYRQPVTRAALSEALGREVSRDVLARLKRIGLIGGGPRVAQAGALLTYVTTRRFLSVFGLATLRDLPEIEMVQGGGAMQSDMAHPGKPEDGKFDEATTPIRQAMGSMPRRWS
jgi:chromosome segregation and condensation protein ScpB